MNNDVQYFCIDAEDQGQRLDNYLIKKLKGVPKSFIYRIIRGGEVRINKKRVKPLVKLQEGDLVRVPPVRLSTPSQIIQGSKEQWAWLENQIIHEEDDFLVLNKPSGIAVHGGSGVNLGIIEMLQRLRSPSLELGHRLDKETSGCLIIAKKRAFLKKFHELLREKKIKKEYNALLFGQWEGRKKQTVEQPLLKNITQSGERFVKIHPEGKEAKTSFELIENYREACWVKAFPVTGRTHQIRVHALYLGHPIIGDDKYGQKNIHESMPKCPRLCLHAKSIQFLLPDERGLCYFEAPIDNKLSHFLNSLEKVSDGSTSETL